MKQKRKKCWIGAVIGAATSLIGSAIQADGQRKAQRKQNIAQNKANTYEMANNLTAAYANQDYADELQNKVVFKAGGTKHYTSRKHPNAVVKSIVNNPRMFKCGGKSKAKR